MAYQRPDLSENLIHLIRAKDKNDAITVLWSIMQSQEFRGGTGYIAGGHECICFTETPLSMVTNYIQARRDWHPKDGRVFYPLGVMVSKRWAFAHGGLPVIYQPEADRKLLDKSIEHRHVKYELGVLNEVDWTHEREWRIQAKQIKFTPDDVTIILPNRHWAKQLSEHHMSNVRAKVQNHAMAGAEYAGLAGQEVDPFPWHYICLADLGYPVSVTI